MNKNCDRRKNPFERLRVLDSSKLDINGCVRTSPHVRTFPYDNGYLHDGRTDKDPYPHDRRADKDSYPLTAIISALS